MSLIDKTAIIHPEAFIGQNVAIGPYSIIGKSIIQDNCTIHPYVFIGDGTEIESNVEVHHGAVIGKEPAKTAALSYETNYFKSIKIGANSSIGSHAIIYYDVEVGSNCLIGDGASIREQGRIGNKCVIGRYVTLNYNNKIGDEVKIMDLTHLTGNMVVGNKVFISAGVMSANDNIIRIGYGEHVIGATIEEGAIIGLGAALLPQIVIGKGAQVGAAALVTKDVPKDSLVMGLPAKARLMVTEE